MNILWYETPIYVQLLEYFSTPRDRLKPFYESMNDRLKENPDSIVRRFISDSLLTSASIAEMIATLYKKDSIEDKLKELGLSTSGSKARIIERLVNEGRASAEKMVEGREMLVCSAKATAFLAEYYIKRDKAESIAKQASFAALVQGDDREAHRLAVEYWRKFSYYSPESYASDEQVKYLLNGQSALISQLSSENKALLRAACCMPLLWYEEEPLRWLPNTLSSPFGSNEVLITLFTRYAEIMERLDGHKDEDKFQIVFDRYDLDSCDLCRKLDGMVLPKKDIPELPFLNCSSQKGCQCELQYQWHSSYNIDDASDEDTDDEADTGIIIDLADVLDIGRLNELIAEKVEQYIRENVETKLDPLSKLKQLKQMLDEGLITEEEYREAKQRILSRL